MEKYYDHSLNTEEVDQIVDEYADIIMKYSGDKEAVRSYIKDLLDKFISSFNTFQSIDSYLDTDPYVHPYWIRARKKVLEGNNSGWVMMFKEMMDDLTRHEEPPCFDCGEDVYGSEIIFSDEEWKKIFPEKRGNLCPSCITSRIKLLSKNAKIIAKVEFKDQ
jgi:hypothetical protein